MCAPVALLAVAAGTQAAAGGATAISQYQQGAAQNKYYNYLADQSQAQGANNLKIADKQSTLIQDQASQEGKQLKTNQAEFNSAQRASLSANGVTGVTAQDIVSSSLSKEQMDEFAVRYNADVKSWQTNTEGQYKNWAANVQADQYRYAGKAAKSAGKTQAFTTLLSTAASVASTAYGGIKKK